MDEVATGVFYLTPQFSLVSIIPPLLPDPIFKARLNRRTGLHVSPKQPALQDMRFSIILLKNHVFCYDTPC